MAANAGYLIVDEPRPTGLAKLASNPTWALLASMLGGAWIGWPWLLVNAHATGSPTRWRETAWLVFAPLGSLALLFLVVVARRAELVPPWAVPYCMVAITAWKLGVAYVVFMMQQRTFALLEYFGGTVRTGAPLLLAGIVLRSRVLQLVDSVVWLVLVG